MKALLLAAYGDLAKLSFGDVPDLTAGAGEVLIKVAATGLNPVEMYVRMGYMAQYIPLQFPAVLGLDAAGTITAVGAGVTGYAVGDRVLAKLAINGQGGQAEYTKTGVKHLAKLPASISFETAATLGLVGLTGRQAVNALGIKAGDRVLVTGALGGVGRVAVQYLKELGAVPVAGVRGERLDEAKALAGEAVDIGSDTTGGYAAAVDTVGGEVAGAAIALVKDGGTLAAVAGIPEAANGDARIKIANVMATEDPAMQQAVVNAAARGDLYIPIAKTFTLADGAQAHSLLPGGKVGGKIILVP